MDGRILQGWCTKCLHGDPLIYNTHGEGQHNTRMYQSRRFCVMFGGTTCHKFQDDRKKTPLHIRLKRSFKNIDLHPSIYHTEL